MKILIQTILVTLLLITMTPNAKAVEFRDVLPDRSLYEEIHFLVDEGVIKGYEDGTFRPSQLVSKKHIASMLVKALNLPMTNLQNPGYKDVPVTHAYYKEIAAGYTAGIFSKAQYFNPDSNISRAFMAKILAHAYQLEVIIGSEDTGFSDVSTESPFFTPISKVASNQIAGGYNDGTFLPNALISRAHFAAFLARAMSRTNAPMTKNKLYTYYYEQDNEVRRFEFVKTYDGADYWDVYDDATGNYLHTDIYRQNGTFYGETMAGYGGYFLAIPTPFRIGDVQAKYPADAEVTILNTRGFLTVRGTSYTNVLVLKEVRASKQTIISYYATDVGLLLSTTEDGRELIVLAKRQKK